GESLNLGRVLVTEEKPFPEYNPLLFNDQDRDGGLDFADVDDDNDGIMDLAETDCDLDFFLDDHDVDFSCTPDLENDPDTGTPKWLGYSPQGKASVETSITIKASCDIDPSSVDATELRLYELETESAINCSH